MGSLMIHQGVLLWLSALVTEELHQATDAKRDTMIMKMNDKDPEGGHS